MMFFFLTLQEVLDLHAGDRSAVGYIPTRVKTHSRYGTLSPYPSVIRGRFDPFQWAVEEHRYSDFYNTSAPLETIETLKDLGRLIAGCSRFRRYGGRPGTSPRQP